MDGERVRCARVAALLLVGSAFAVLPAAAQAKPDLVIAGQATVNPDYFLRGGGDVGTFTDRTKNKGDKARASETSLVLVHSPEVRETVIGSRDVPKLKPGKSDFGNASADASGLTPGAYDAIVCADYRDKVKEKNESNNCVDLGSVYVIVSSWFGTLSGDGPTAAGGSTKEAWQSDDAEFRFVESLGDGRFSYKFHGSLTYTVSGTDSSDCEYSGTDTTTIAGDAVGQGLILDYRKEEYFGNEAVGGFPFTWRVTCEGFFQEESPGPLDVAGGFIVVNPQELETQPMPFGSTSLTGNATSDLNGSQFNWLLGAGN